MIVLSAATVFYFQKQGALLFYGDAEAHLNIARRVFDSRTPGLRQIGTVWLPVPHLLMLPFVQNDALWESGLAGALPSAGCFVLAALLLFAAARRLFGPVGAAAALCAFTLNPNLLYLQATPMTQPAFLAFAVATFYFAVRFRESPSRGWIIAAGVAAAVASLTRYEGWFALPFLTAYFGVTARTKRIQAMVLFATVAGLGPLIWFGHNAWFWGDLLAFYRGPYSAKASYAHSLAAGLPHYRGDHDWALAWLYYRTAVKDCLGWPLVILGATGLIVAVAVRRAWVIFLLAPAPLFYVWVLHSGGIPIFVPELWPNSLYNTRYGLAALPLFAMGAGALVTLAANQRRAWAAALATTGGIAGVWLAQGGLGASICLREARDTSLSRRAYTDEAAAFLRNHYRTGDGIWMCFGDLTGILREAHIPLREALIQDNEPLWASTLEAPASRLREAWMLTSQGDLLSSEPSTLGSSGVRFQCLDTITEKGAPPVSILRRGS